jgi:hypothetical protein
MTVNVVAIFFMVATFHSASAAHPYAFAGWLWVLFFCLAGVFSMHPAVCAQVFGPGKDIFAIGIIGSSEIITSLIIGNAMNGFFPSLSSYVHTHNTCPIYFDRFLKQENAGSLRMVGLLRANFVDVRACSGRHTPFP